MANYFVESDANEEVIATGTALAIADPASNYISLAATSSYLDDFYNTYIVELLGGTGAGQARYIVDYSGAEQKAYVSSNWAIRPDSTTTYKIVKRSLIAEGEIGTPSVLNRPYFSLINNDLNLESVVQFLTRSSILHTTSNTKFLAHFKGSGKDEISGFLPENPQTIYDESLYTYDNAFFGVAWPQKGPVTNLLSSGSPYADPSLCDAANWSVSKDLTVDVGTINSSSGMRIYTTGKESPTNGGTMTITGVAIPLSPYATPDNIISISLGYTNKINFYEEDVTLEYGVKCYNNADTLFDTISETKTTLINSTGRFEINGHAIDAPPGGSTSVYFKPFITLTYPNGASLDITLKNFMVERGAYSHTFVAGTRTPPISATYTEVVTNPNLFSILFWTKIRDTVFSAQTADFGPLFLESANDTIGIINAAADRGSRKLSLTRVDSSHNITPSESITIGGDSEAYVPVLLRGNSTSNILELLVIDPTGALHKTSMPYALRDPVLPLSIKLGASTEYPTLYDCPITELRYDTEWINDLEFRLIALAAHPFGKPILAVEASDATLDGVNLIKNPDGKIGTEWWTPTSDFAAGCNDTVGYSLAYTRASTVSDVAIKQTVKVSATPQEQFTVSSVIGSSLTSGQYGISITFYNASNEPVSTFYKYAKVNADDTLYSFTTTVPEDITSAEFGLIVEAGTTIDPTGYIRWSRIKAERGGTSTNFTIDSSPQYAVYAP